MKWIALGLAGMAALLIVCWAVLLPNDPQSAQLALGKEPSYVCLAVGKGDLILCDHFANREVIQLLDRLKPTQRGVTIDIRTALPGFNFRHLTLTTGQQIWSLELSLLIPAMIMVLLSSLLFWILRILPGVTFSPEPPNESAQRIGILARPENA